jgi:hypothetical protein
MAQPFPTGAQPGVQLPVKAFRDDAELIGDDAIDVPIGHLAVVLAPALEGMPGI